MFLINSKHFNKYILYNLASSIMVEPVQQLEETYADSLIIPEPIKRTIANYRKAQHGFKLTEKDDAYIEYNTLREQRIDTEEVTIPKIQRLYDRDTQKEWIVYFKKSRCKDFTNNYVDCPIVEKLGVVPEPVANISNDAQNRVKKITIVEQKNDYYIPFSKEKLIELFESSKDRHKIVCYVGYTRETRVNDSDTIEGKKIIWNQDKFVNASFSELVDTDEDVIKVLDVRKQYIIPNRVRDLTNNNKPKPTTKRVESLAELTKDLNVDSNKPKKISSSGDIENDTQKEYNELMNNQ